MECTDCHATGFTPEELEVHQNIDANDHPQLDMRALREHAKYDECEGEGLVIPSEDPRVAGLEKELTRVTAIVAQLEAAATGKALPPPKVDLESKVAALEAKLAALEGES